MSWENPPQPPRMYDIDAPLSEEALLVAVNNGSSMAPTPLFLAPGSEIPQIEPKDPLFGVKVLGCEYVMSSTLDYSANGSDETTLWADAMEAVGNVDTPRFYQTLLQGVFQNPDLQLKHILEGVSAGAPYFVFGYTTPAQEAAAKAEEKLELERRAAFEEFLIEDQERELVEFEGIMKEVEASMAPAEARSLKRDWLRRISE